MIIENWNIEDVTGYRVKTTFYTDFSIAEILCVDSIRSTYTQCFKYITELCMVLNWKMFRWFEVKDNFYEVYRELYRTLDDWCIENLKGEELEYYYFTTD